MINSFTGQYRFLSNFYPVWIHYEGLDYPSVEYAYQAAKATNSDDRELIAKSKTAGAAKKLGQHIKCRKDWQEVKVSIMRDLEQIKYAQQELLQKLLATGDEYLIESNWWHDQFWGSCTCPMHYGVEGKNMLGKLLMEVREQYAKALSSTVAECEIGED